MCQTVSDVLGCFVRRSSSISMLFCVYMRVRLGGFVSNIISLSVFFKRTYVDIQICVRVYMYVGLTRKTYIDYNRVNI